MLVHEKKKNKSQKKGRSRSFGAEIEFRQALSSYDNRCQPSTKYRASALMHFAGLLWIAANPTMLWQ